MQSRLEFLFYSYIKQNCSFEEEEELMELLAQPRNKREVQTLLDKLFENAELETKMPHEAAASILKNILKKDKVAATVTRKKTVFMTWTRVAAATLILFVSVLLYWALSKGNHEKGTVTATIHQKQFTKVLPGGNHAILTMANGSTVVLDSMQNGNVQHGNAIIRKQNGLIVFNAPISLNGDLALSYNTLTTPPGGQYEVVLPDGSKVWLNASSSLRFPTAFRGNHRNVELTGEGYFEVSKNKKKPFHVKVNGMQVEVLGTHFNINAYDDECSIKTSLLEGSVKISKGNLSGLLKPGQQAIIKKNSQKLKIRNVDVNEVVAWKNGLFQFDGADIKTIMRQIGRWYNVEIDFAGKLPERRFEGTISRNAQLSDVLKILEFSNVKFSVQGNKIVVQ